MFALGLRKVPRGLAGALAACEDVDEVEEFDWPRPDFLDFAETLEELRKAGDVYRASVFWNPFHHSIKVRFGVGADFIKMYAHPDVAHVVTDRVCDFYTRQASAFSAGR